MPEISSFYGIIIQLYAYDNLKHHRPHIHAKFSGKKAIIAIDDGFIFESDIPANKMKLVQAWIEIHKKELMDDWLLAVSGRKPFRIEPLR